MKKLVWQDEEQATVGGIGLVTKGSIFIIDDKRADSFIDQKKAMLKDDTAVDGSVKTKTVKKEG